MDIRISLLATALAVIIVLAAVIRSRIPRPTRGRDLWLMIAGSLVSLAAALVLFGSGVGFLPTRPSSQDWEGWYILFLVRIILQGMGLSGVALIAIGLSQMGVIAMPWWRRLMRLALTCSALATWILLSKSARLVEEIAGLSLWLACLLLAIALTTGVALLGPRNDPGFAGWADPVALALAFSALGSLLLAARFIPLAAEALWNADLVQPFLVFLAAALYCLAMIGWLAGGRAPRTAVFLRRFGRGDLNRALRKATRRSRGDDRWRLITLDDRQFMPIGANRVPVIGCSAAGAVVTTVGASGVYWVVSNFDELFGVAEARPTGVSLILSSGLTLGGFLICLAVTVLVLVACYLHSFGSRRLSIGSSNDVDHLSRSLQRTRAWSRARSMSTPRAQVVGTDHSCWRYAVLELMKAADVVFLDVSDLSDNVQWELDRLSESFPEKAVLLKREGGPSALIPELAGATVVTYSSYSALARSLTTLQKRAVRSRVVACPE